MTLQKIDAQSPEAQSADLQAENIAKLKALFPELVTEGPNSVAINQDVLKQLVGDTTVTDTDEKYGLNWHGKRAARQLALTPSTGTLLPCPDESVDWNSTQNLMIEGDNLEVLKLLQKSYAGKVKLIFIDPPYNTGKDFVYPDDFRDNVKNYKELTGQIDTQGKLISSNAETSGRFHTDWLNMIYPRLKLARNLLKSDGVLFITIDDNEVTNLKHICNEIFGEENFRGTLIWQHSLQPKGYSGTFSVHHNYVLCYQKSDAFELSNLARTDEHNKNYSNPDNDPNGPWRTGDVRNALYRPNLIYPITTPSGKTIEPPQNGWRWSKETLAEKIASGEIIFSSDETRIIRKIYLNTLEGRTPETIIFGKEVGTTRDAASEIKSLFDGETPFDTPKPTGLIQHLISLSNAKDQDIVIDFFAGSGTTGHATYSYNVTNGTTLRNILIQLPEPLSQENKEQLSASNYCKKLGLKRNIAELTKERLRRAGSSIKLKQPLLALDIGFRVYKLDTSNVKAWTPDPTEFEKTLLDHQEHLLSERSQSDILTELLLKLGLDLCVPIEKRIYSGKQVYCIGAGTLFVCLDEQLSRQDIEPLANGIHKWHRELSPASDTTCIFRDSAFIDDIAKTNLAAILKQQGLTNVRSI